MKTNARSTAGAWRLGNGRGPADYELNEKNRHGESVLGRMTEIDPILAGDLRRRRRAADAEWLVSRAQWLAEADRALVEAVYRDGKTTVELARLLETDACTVRRRMKKLVRRLASSKAVWVARHMERWSPMRRRVATACVLHGLSLRESASEVGQSLYAVRQHMHAIDALYEARPEVRRAPVPPQQRGRRVGAVA